jgi:type I restriction enzyme S subunit
MFYREEKFRQTAIGRIPYDWKVVMLGKLATEVYRYPTYYNITYVDSGVPEVRGELIRDYGEFEEDLTEYRFISEETSRKFPRTILREGDFVLSVRGTMGKIAVVPEFLEGGNITANLVRISLERSQCYPPFFKQIFLSRSFQETMNNLSSQTTIKTIQAPVLKSMKLALPPLSEQRKIAGVLSTADKAIQKTDEIIVKTERLKQGLMQQLLTKGIGHKEFKDSEIGRIPKEWGIVDLGSIVSREKGKTPRMLVSQREDGALAYLSAETLRTGLVTQWAKDTSEVVRVDKNDLLLIWDGFYCGDSFTGFEGALSSTMVKIEPRDRGVYKGFLFYFLKTRFKELNSKIAGMYLKHVSKAVFESLKIPLPSPREQQKIAEILSTVDKKLELERNHKAKLEKAKQGLMDLLLMGKIRIKVD